MKTCKICLREFPKNTDHFYPMGKWLDSPSQKDFGIGKSSIKVLEKLKPELDKCVMLCANCHRIRHARLYIR